MDKDWEGKKYWGITLNWDYTNHKVHLSMPGYCKEGLTQFRHELQKIMDQLHDHVAPVCGTTIQYAKDIDTSKKLGPEDTKFIQQVTGTFLYYARARGRCDDVSGVECDSFRSIGPNGQNYGKNVQVS